MFWREISREIIPRPFGGSPQAFQFPQSADLTESLLDGDFKIT
jgi:hypothetical protein